MAGLETNLDWGCRTSRASVDHGAKKSGYGHMAVIILGFGEQRQSTEASTTREIGDGEDDAR